MIFSVLRIQTKPLFLFSLYINFKVPPDCFLEVIKEFGENYRTLITQLRPMFHLWRIHVLDLLLQNLSKATVGK